VMLGRRRRPVLGAAVLVGVSRSAARHEVQKQSQQDDIREMEIEREVERRRREEEEQQRRTQLAVDEAVKKSGAGNQPAQYVNFSNQPPLPQQAAMYQVSAPPPYQGPSYGRPSSTSNTLYNQPQAQLLGHPPESPPYIAPTYLAPPVPQRPKSANGLTSPGSYPMAKSTNCSMCGHLFAPEDLFCAKCGTRLEK